ncbi:MAG: glucose-6-phosphate isomerase, partial [Paracoccaceae bacterium]
MWNDLKSHAARIEGRTLLSMFDDTNRADGYAVETQSMRLDYSKTQIDESIRDDLLKLAAQLGVAARRDAMFAGEKINETEGRAVLHTALRNLDGSSVMVDGQDVMPGVLETLASMEAYATQVRASGITDVVNIGIGGSDLGPAMAVLAMAPYHDGPRCHFVSNVDGAHIADVLQGLDAKTTLVIVASKTFTTIETMTNARTARAWMQDNGGDPASQFAALSTAEDKTAAFGIPSERVFGFEDWVGGRYSVWGPIGLSLMIAIGPKAFRAFLSGGQDMDRHFCAAEGVDNMPLMLALVGVWHRQVLGHASRAVLPYDQRLSRLAAYFQQLEMESNGKS